MNFSITNGKEMRLTKEERLYAGLQFWRLKTEYWYSRFQRASEGRRKWRKEAKGLNHNLDRTIIEYLAMSTAYTRQKGISEDADLRRIGYKALTALLLGVIAVLLISWG